MNEMRLKLLIQLPDTPGQLVNILQPLSNYGTNVSIIIDGHNNKAGYIKQIFLKMKQNL